MVRPYPSQRKSLQAPTLRLFDKLRWYALRRNLRCPDTYRVDNVTLRAVWVIRSNLLRLVVFQAADLVTRAKQQTTSIKTVHLRPGSRSQTQRDRHG
jgi:hypothetical protein